MNDQTLAIKTEVKIKIFHPENFHQKYFLGHKKGRAQNFVIFFFQTRKIYFCIEKKTFCEKESQDKDRRGDKSNLTSFRKQNEKFHFNKKKKKFLPRHQQHLHWLKSSHIKRTWNFFYIKKKIKLL